MSADPPVDPAILIPDVGRQAITISIPAVNPAGGTDVIIVSIPLASAGEGITVIRSSADGGPSIDLIKPSGSDGGGG